MSDSFWNGRRVVVTGATSGLGFELTRKLSESGALVHGIGRREIHDPASYHLDSYSRVNLLDGQLDLSIHTPSVIFHLASNQGDIKFVSDEPLITFSNLLIDECVIDWAVKIGAPRFVFGSSANASSTRHSLPPPSEGGPQGLFGYTKRVSEVLLEKLNNNSVLNSVSARLFTVYGSTNSNGGVIEHWVRSAIEMRALTVLGGSQFRTFVHVADAVNALMILGEDVTVNGQVDVGSNDVISLNHAARLVADSAPNRVKVITQPYPFGSTADQIADCTSVMGLGWSQSLYLSKYLQNLW